LSENLRLTKKQILFLLEWLEETDYNKAAERFAKMMVEGGIDPSDMDLVIDKIMVVVERKKK
jgi:hypothetical protein